MAKTIVVIEAENGFVLESLGNNNFKICTTLEEVFEDLCSHFRTPKSDKGFEVTIKECE